MISMKRIFSLLLTIVLLLSASSAMATKKKEKETPTPAPMAIQEEPAEAPEEIQRRMLSIHIDVDPAEIGKNMQATVPLVGNVKVILNQLLERK